MNQKEAKERSIEFWRYMAAHPELAAKCDTPPDIFKLVSDCRASCPLCEVFFEKKSTYSSTCAGCPLDAEREFCPTYFEWKQSDTNAGRRLAAEAIVAKIAAWTPQDIPESDHGLE